MAAVVAWSWDQADSILRDTLYRECGYVENEDWKPVLIYPFEPQKIEVSYDFAWVRKESFHVKGDEQPRVVRRARHWG
jgi:hypothetical protein